MAAEEKLKYIYDSTISAIRTHGEDEQAQIRARLDESLADYEKTVRAEAEMQERIHRDNVKREMQKELASLKLSLRRQQAEKESRITEQLFEEVTAILGRFRETPEYEQLLVDLVLKAKEFAQDEEIVIYLSRDDADKKEIIEQRSGVPLELSEVPFRGGIQAKIPSRNIFINNSFSSRVEDAKRNYIVKA